MMGVGSGFSYSGAINVYELWEKAKFVRVTNAGIVGSGSHALP